MRDARSPRSDVLALAEVLSATVIAPEPAPSTSGKALRMGRSLATAWRAFVQRDSYDVILTEDEIIGVTLAFLLKASRSKQRHFTVGHGVATHRGWNQLVRLLNIQTHIERVICYGPAAAEVYTRVLRLPPGKTAIVHHAADHHYWRPEPVEPEPFILSSLGMKYHDTATLLQGARAAGVRVVLAGISSRQGTRVSADLTGGGAAVTKVWCTPSDMRDLYARALFVAVPVQGVRNGQVGTMLVYQAMAMGKAIVATRTPGLEAIGAIRDGETGIYVPEGDVAAWEKAIQFLLANPQEAMRMGANARQEVEAGLNLDTYIDGMTAILIGSPSRIERKAQAAA
jgi:glycosyltransferase involved in cell wall biosynthesis